MINAMALTNPGIHSWKRNWYDGIVRRGYPVILSIALDDADQAVEFGRYVNRLDDLAGIELNVSCPSTEHRFAASDQICEIVSSFCRWCQIPTGIKLGYTDPYIDIATRTDGLMAWFDIINTVPWDSWFDAHWSRDCDRDVPIPSGDWWLDYRKYGVNSPVVRSTGKSGGISGPAIRYMAQSTLEKLRKATKAPIISGGGLFTKQDVLLRFNLGANAVALGTVCLHRPWRVNSMVRLAIQADVACAGNLHHQRRLS